MVRRILNEIKVIDVEKRRVPSKHYVYIINVTWSDGTIHVIYRRYSRFFELQTRLLEEFPTESGCYDPTKRIIPFLPGKKLFGRSHVRSVALQRMEPINDYCKTIIKLPPKISQNEMVMKFFEPTPEDILPVTEEDDKKTKKQGNRADIISEPILLDQYIAIADYRKQAKNELSLVAGDVLEIIDKNENGWWFVNLEDEQGWVPASFLETVDGTPEDAVVEKFDPGKEQKYIATEVYTPEQKDEIGLEKGVVVEVTQKCADGWWLVRFRGKEGWAPGMYLRKLPANQSSLVPKQETKPSPSTQKEKPQENSQGGSRSTKPPPRKGSVKRSVKLKDRRNRLQKRETGPSTGPEMFIPDTEYVTLADFRASAVNSGLDVKEGIAVEILEKSPNGWWFAKIGDKEGWMPSSFLEKREKEGVLKPNPVAFGYKVPDKCAPTVPEKPPKGSSPAPGVPRKSRSKSLDNLIDDGADKLFVPPLPGERPRSRVLPYEVIEVEGNFSKPVEGKPTPLPRFAPKFNAMVEKQRLNEPPPRPQRPQILAEKPKISPRLKPREAHEKPKRQSQVDAGKDVAIALNFYEPDFDGGIALKENQEVEVLDKTEHWWYVKINEECGWAPSNYLKIKETTSNNSVEPAKKPNTNQVKNALTKQLENMVVSNDQVNSGYAMLEKNNDDKNEIYVAIASYQDSDGEALGFIEGEKMEILEKSDGGWWFVKLREKKGWVPSNFIRPL